MLQSSLSLHDARKMLMLACVFCGNGAVSKPKTNTFPSSQALKLIRLLPCLHRSVSNTPLEPEVDYRGCSVVQRQVLLCRNSVRPVLEREIRSAKAQSLHTCQPEVTMEAIPTALLCMGHWAMMLADDFLLMMTFCCAQQALWQESNSIEVDLTCLIL